MAPTPVPDNGGDHSDSEQQQGLRLGDVEGIAARRLDDATPGSLREALAIAPADDMGEAPPPPALRIADVDESFAASPLVRFIDAPYADAGRTEMREPQDAFSPMQRPPVLDLGIALVQATHDVPAPPTAAAPETPDGADGTAGIPSEEGREAAPEPPGVPSSSLEAAAQQSVEPLTSALDAAVKLAADANVAAEALENLRRLLEHKQQLERHLPHFAGGPAPAGNPAAPTPVAPPLPPLPLPLHSEQDAGSAPAAGTRAVPPRRRSRRRAPPERRGFDLRGFMAGFALSWAFGVVFYLFMTAG